MQGNSVRLEQRRVHARGTTVSLMCGFELPEHHRLARAGGARRDEIDERRGHAVERARVRVGRPAQGAAIEPAGTPPSRGRLSGERIRAAEALRGAPEAASERSGAAEALRREAAKARGAAGATAVNERVDRNTCSMNPCHATAVSGCSCRYEKVVSAVTCGECHEESGLRRRV